MCLVSPGQFAILPVASQKACVTATQGATDLEAPQFNPRRPPKCLPPLGDMLGPTWARSNCLGHSMAKTAEALGIRGKDNRYQENGWADKPQARWGGIHCEVNSLLHAAALHHLCGAAAVSGKF